MALAATETEKKISWAVCKWTMGGVLTGLGVELLGNGLAGLLELLQEVGGDGQEVDTGESADLADLWVKVMTQSDTQTNRQE